MYIFPTSLKFYRWFCVPPDVGTTAFEGPRGFYLALYFLCPVLFTYLLYPVKVPS